jgi:glycine betaine/proline transport system ATP-binding protein
MQQRVGLARALATDADILLMDEAFSALDPLIRTQMQDILLGLQEELHKTIIFITHDLDEALRIGDQIAILRDGSVIQEGDPQDIIMNPADAYISDFIKDINRSRVIEVRSVMEKPNGGQGPKVGMRSSIEDALQVFATANVQTTLVVDEADHVVGQLDLHDAIAAMSRPVEGDDAGQHYK